MPSKKVLAERIAGNERLRLQLESWERDRRIEDRLERAKKDEELNGVRFQLREQAATFVTKDMFFALERSFDQKLDTAIDRLNSVGTEESREVNAERLGREEATREILSATKSSAESSATNRRWLIGLIVSVAFGILANAVTVAGLVIHLVTSPPRP